MNILYNTGKINIMNTKTGALQHLLPTICADSNEDQRDNDAHRNYDENDPPFHHCK